MLEREAQCRARRVGGSKCSCPVANDEQSPYCSLSTSSTKSLRKALRASEVGPKDKQPSEEVTGQRLIEKEAMETGKVREGILWLGGGDTVKSHPTARRFTTTIVA